MIKQCIPKLAHHPPYWLPDIRFSLKGTEPTQQGAKNFKHLGLGTATFRTLGFPWQPSWFPLEHRRVFQYDRPKSFRQQVSLYLFTFIIGHLSRVWRGIIMSVLPKVNQFEMFIMGWSMCIWWHFTDMLLTEKEMENNRTIIMPHYVWRRVQAGDGR